MHELYHPINISIHNPSMTSNRTIHERNTKWMHLSLFMAPYFYKHWLCRQKTQALPAEALSPSYVPIKLHVDSVKHPPLETFLFTSMFRLCGPHQKTAASLQENTCQYFFTSVGGFIDIDEVQLVGNIGTEKNSHNKKFPWVSSFCFLFFCQWHDVSSDKSLTCQEQLWIRQARMAIIITRKYSDGIQAKQGPCSLCNSKIAKGKQMYGC